MMNAATALQKAERFELIRQLGITQKRMGIAQEVKNFLVAQSPTSMAELGNQINNPIAIRSVFNELGALGVIATYLVNCPLVGRDEATVMIASDRRLDGLVRPGSTDRGRYAEHPIWKKSENLFKQLLATLDD